MKKAAIATATSIALFFALYHFWIFPNSWSCDPNEFTLNEIKVRESFVVPFFRFRADTGNYPTTEEGINALIQDTGVEGWKGPYIQDIEDARDSWGRFFVYRYPGKHNKDSYDLYSLGPDGIESEDDIRNRKMN